MNSQQDQEQSDLNRPDEVKAPNLELVARKTTDVSPARDRNNPKLPPINET